MAFSRSENNWVTSASARCGLRLARACREDRRTYKKEEVKRTLYGDARILLFDSSGASYPRASTRPCPACCVPRSARAGVPRRTIAASPCAFPASGYTPCAWGSGVRLCRRATGQGIPRPTVRRWCITPEGFILQGSFCWQQRTPEPCLRKRAERAAPGVTSGSVCGSVRSLTLRLAGDRVAHAPIGDSPGGGP